MANKAENKKYVLLTRPLINSLKVAKKCKKLGFTPLCLPVLKIKYLNSAQEKLQNLKTTSLIITSGNALRALKFLTRNKFDKSLEIFTVGEKTASLAKCYGFKNVKTANGNVKSLIELLKQENPNKKFTYLRGKHITKQLPKNLNFQEIIVYSRKKLNNYKIPSKVKENLIKNNMSKIFIYSKRSRDSFIKLLENNFIAPKKNK